MNIISEVLSACVSSARSEPMKLKLPNGKYFTIPSQVNVMMLMPSGSGKSTYIKELPKKSFIEVEDYTLPALLGSIDDRGDIIPGYVQKAAGKCLIPDEFHSLKFGSRKALLKLTEQQSACRVLGRAVKRPYKIRKKYLKCSTIDNEIRIEYVRMSVMLSGIFAPHKSSTNVDDFAFSSRFLPISLNINFDELDDIALGKRFFEIKYDPYVESPVFEDWEKFVRCYREVVNNLPPKINNFLLGNSEFYQRFRLQIARFFAYAFRDNSVVDDWGQYIPYIPFFLYNCVAATLTHSEFEIYSLMKSEESQKNIAGRLSVSEAFVSSKIKKLRGVGLG